MDLYGNYEKHVREMSTSKMRILRRMRGQQDIKSSTRKKCVLVEKSRM